MKFLLVTGLYADAARGFTAGLESELKDYVSLYDLYSRSAFAGADRYAIHLEELGWDANAVFANDKLIQIQWAREHGLPIAGRGWCLDVLCDQIRYYQSEVIFILDLYRFNRFARDEIRRRCPSVRWIVGWRSAPIRENEDFTDLDLFLSSLESLVFQMRNNGIKAERLSAGFDSLVLEQIPEVKRDLPITFFGSIGSEDGVHSLRRELLAAAFTRTPLQVWSDSAEVLYNGDRGLISSFLRRRRIHHGVYGINMYRFMARSHTTLNAHINMAGTEAVNLRLFEATGMGACLITDNPRGAENFFHVNSEIVAYTCIEDLVEKVDYLLEHPKEAIEIAARGRSRTLREHTLRHRTSDLEAILEKELFRN